MEEKYEIYLTIFQLRDFYKMFQNNYFKLSYYGFLIKHYA